MSIAKINNISGGSGGYDIVQVGTGYNSTNNYTIDVSNITDKYGDLTTSNFLMGNVSFNGSTTGANDNVIDNGNIISSYNASTGTLTLSKKYFEHYWTTGRLPLAYITYDLYAYVPK